MSSAEEVKEELNDQAIGIDEKNGQHSSRSDDSSVADDVDDNSKKNEATSTKPQQGADTPPSAAVRAQMKMIGAPYARILPLPPSIYYIELIFIGLTSTLCGLLALGYLNVVYEVPKLWLTAQDNDEYPDDPATTTYAAGHPWWIGVTTLSGLIVGILKAYIFQFDSYPTFVQELMELKVSPRGAVGVGTCCLVSLMGGASVGPEAGLGASCGAIGYLAATPLNWCIRQLHKRHSTNKKKNDDDTIFIITQEEEDRRSKLMVLVGMCAAFSSILPNPAISILLCLELPGFESLKNDHGLEYLPTVSKMTLAGTISFLVYTSLEDYTYLRSGVELPGFAHEYSNQDIAEAMAFGAMGAGLALVYVIVGSLVKKITAKAKSKLQDRFGKKPRIVIVCMLGGACFGTLGYLFPLTVGDGSFQMRTVIVSGGEIDSGVLASSAFVKMATFWITQETGFVGGMFYPLLITSTLMGRVFVNEMNSGWAIAMACSLVAMASALTPMPFAMFVLALSAFDLDSLGSVPVLMSVVIAHLAFCGVGIPQGLAKMQAAKAKKRAAMEDSKENAPN